MAPFRRARCSSSPSLETRSDPDTCRLFWTAEGNQRTKPGQEWPHEVPRENQTREPLQQKQQQKQPPSQDSSQSQPPRQATQGEMERKRREGGVCVCVC
ncbi:hypothetical protein WMY93_029408 [Mugilogobius chulae]|uniref:Uncharacterized protein n=1 Tax=Mugilogobius chulae TaxID=88201 RepID=A0AAW0N058_9GOBI